MRTNEKVLNLLYDEILNGKTKNEVNGPQRGVKRKKQVLGDAAVGQQVAKMFVNEHGLPDLYRGVVASFIEEGKEFGGVYFTSQLSVFAPNTVDLYLF